MFSLVISIARKLRMETRIQVSTMYMYKYFPKNLFIRIQIRRQNIGSEVTIDVEVPWYGKYGLYNHFHDETKGRTIRWVF